jgi:hypothetical protein
MAVIIPYVLTPTSRTEIRESLVPPGLVLDLVEIVLRRPRDEDDGAISRRLLQEFGAPS